VFPDCWTRLGGNQYINSSAVGNYADHLVREVVPQVDERYRTAADPRKRAVFGKSSGGYGALIQGMKYARHWGAIACHSGDLYFDFCYRHEIPRVLTALAEFGGDPKKFLKAFYARRKPDGDTHTLMFLAMAAFYDPDPEAPLGFRLPMDLQTGEVDEKRWARWLRHDPIELAKKAGVQKQLRSLRGIYFDCGTRDQYHLHYGARILHKRLREARISHHYEEFDVGPMGSNLTDGSQAHTSDALIFFQCPVLCLGVRCDSSALDVDHLIHTDLTIRREGPRENNNPRPVHAWPHDLNGLGGRYNSWKHV
jgi:S-formylglutathione hydrolase FrmB